MGTLICKAEEGRDRGECDSGLDQIKTGDKLRFINEENDPSNST